MIQFERFVSVIGLPRMVYRLAVLNVIERKKLPIKSFVLTMSPGGKPPGNTRSLPLVGTPAGDQLAGADQLPEGSAPVHVVVVAARTPGIVARLATTSAMKC